MFDVRKNTLLFLLFVWLLFYAVTKHLRKLFVYTYRVGLFSSHSRVVKLPWYLHYSQKNCLLLLACFFMLLYIGIQEKLVTSIVCFNIFFILLKMHEKWLCTSLKIKYTIFLKFSCISIFASFFLLIKFLMMLCSWRRWGRSWLSWKNKECMKNVWKKHARTSSMPSLSSVLI